ncbi:MAG: hypothetical protein H6739_16370 [Alphaproteobacteria bacterium]|nr:hypothetical protein [Alphaproteobacteria bacterium]
MIRFRHALLIGILGLGVAATPSERLWEAVWQARFAAFGEAVWAPHVLDDWAEGSPEIKVRSLDGERQGLDHLEQPMGERCVDRAGFWCEGYSGAWWEHQRAGTLDRFDELGWYGPALSMDAFRHADARFVHFQAVVSRPPAGFDLMARAVEANERLRVPAHKASEAWFVADDGSAVRAYGPCNEHGRFYERVGLLVDAWAQGPSTPVAWADCGMTQFEVMTWAGIGDLCACEHR